MRGSTTVAFGDVVRLAKERSSDPEADGFDRVVGLDHLDPGDLRIRRWGDIADGSTFTTVFRPGQVLFGKRRAYQRKVAVADFSGVCSGDIYVMEPKDKRLLPELLPFICQTDGFFERAVGTSAGSLSPRTKWENLVDFEFKLPSVDKQCQIVELLSASVTNIQALRDVTEGLGTLIKSHLNEHFKRRLSLGVPLASAAQIVAGGTPSRNRKDFWGGTLPWASGKDLKVPQLSTTEEFLTEEGWAVAKIAPVGATLVVVRGMILAHTFPVTQCVTPTAFNQDLRALVARNSLHPDYLNLWATWAAPWFLKRTSESSHGTKRLEGTVLENAVIPVPSRVEQSALLQEVRPMKDALNRLSQRLLVAHSLQRRLLSNIWEVAS